MFFMGNRKSSVLHYVEGQLYISWKSAYGESKKSKQPAQIAQEHIQKPNSGK
jgi:hypothetical protein